MPKAAFFGSLVDGRFQERESDVDILVLQPKGMSLLGFVGLKQDIEDSVKKKVDLVSYNGLSPYLKDRILSERHIFCETKQLRIPFSYPRRDSLARPGLGTRAQ